MTEEFVMALGRDALTTVLLVAAPVLGLSLVVGLLVSIFQATTQLNEATLSFVPKIVAVLLAVVIFGPWMMTVMLQFTSRIFTSLPTLVR
ncbi:MAG: flagellar biosynthesis protein FliQ [Firmicutes bacterium]|nr:flagellar biosynthesis protein FliQ [Bacillota bacterium]